MDLGKFGWSLISMAIGVWIADWAWGAHTDHPRFVALMGAGYIIADLLWLGAKSAYRRLA